MKADSITLIIAMTTGIGISFRDKKQQVRMAAASHLPLTTDCPIRTIAAQVGFATPEHFSKSFKND